MEKTWVRGIGTFVAGLLAMNGLAGAPEDFTTWQRWASKLNVLAPWWAFLAFSAVIVSIIWGPVLLSTIYRRRAAVAAEGPIAEGEKSRDTEVATAHTELPLVREERDQLRQRVAELEAALADEQAECERERGDKETLRKESTELRFAVQNRENDFREVYWKLRYSHDRPVIPDLPLREVVPVRDRTQELRPALVKAAGQCERLLTSLLGAMHAQNEATCLPWLAEFVEDQVLERTKAARQSLENALNNPEDIQHPLIGFCWNYYEAKKWLIRIVGLLEWPSQMASAYQTWLKADKEFRRELERLLARNSLTGSRLFANRFSIWLRKTRLPTAHRRLVLEVATSYVIVLSDRLPHGVDRRFRTTCPRVFNLPRKDICDGAECIDFLEKGEAKSDGSPGQVNRGSIVFKGSLATHLLVISKLRGSLGKGIDRDRETL